MKILWLLGNPAGFKPNSNLSHFLGNFVLSMIRMWNTVTSALTKARQFIVFYLAAVGWLGGSLQAAALHDLLIFCSFWLLCVYSIFQTIYWYVLSMLSTQMKLFRGRKFNTIRRRDDSNSFNVAEMYLGVMVVSLALFLLPTLAIFYFYAFISIIVSVMILQLVLVFVQIVFTEFPFFEIVLSLWQPYILPNGVKIEVCREQEQPVTRLKQQRSNIASCFSKIGSEFTKLLKGSNSSLPKEIVLSILQGRSLLRKMMSLLSILGDQEEPPVLQYSLLSFLKDIFTRLLI